MAPDRLPPHSLDSEHALLGAALHDARAIDRSCGIVQPEDFAEPINGHIFGVMCERREAGEVVDLGLLRAVLGNKDLGGETVGEYLGRLMAGATTIVGAPGYARMIRDAAHMRRILATAEDAVAEMTAGSVIKPGPYAARMIEALDQVASADLAANVKRVKLSEATAAVLARVDRARKEGKPRCGVTYGLESLNRILLGMRRSQLIIAAARPAMGKTALGVHIGVAAARASGPVAMFSLEMDGEELAERVLSSLAYDRREPEPLTYNSIVEGAHLSDRAMERLADAEWRSREIPLWIEQQPGLSVAQIAARARQMRMEAERTGRDLSLIIVDHLGLIRPSGRYAGNRVQEVTEISNALKGLAKEMGLPVLVLCQLNREVEKRDDKHPKLSDLRESGSIEQDADVVLGLYREAYYLANKTDPTDEELDKLFRLRNVMEIEVLKQRSGATPRIEVFCEIGCNVLADISR